VYAIGVMLGLNISDVGGGAYEIKMSSQPVIEKRLKALADGGLINGR
jgi:hypothetical protein